MKKSMHEIASSRIITTPATSQLNFSITSHSTVMDLASIITTSFIAAASDQPALEKSDCQSHYINILLSENRRMQERCSSLGPDNNHVSALAKHRAGFNLFKERRRSTLMQKLQFHGRKSKGWRKELKQAFIEAEEAMKSAHNVDKELDAFYIICTCSFALNENDRRVSLRIITYWIYRLLQEKSIELALEKLAECLHNPESSLLLNEAQLLSKFFKYISAAMMTCALYGNHFYGREQSGDWIPGDDSYKSERDEMRNILRESKHLKKATDPHFIKRWDDIKISDGDNNERVQWGKVHVTPSASTIHEARTDQFFSEEISDCETVLSSEDTDTDSMFEQTFSCCNSIEVQGILMDLCHCDSVERYIPGNVRVCKNGRMNENSDCFNDSIYNDWNDTHPNPSFKNEYFK